MMNQIVRQAVVVAQGSINQNAVTEKVALFDETGAPMAALTFETAPTADNIVLTGYTIAGSAAAVAATDSISEAVGKVEKRVALLETSETGELDTEAEVRATVLTGLSTASATAVVATDSILVAIGKLQAQINAL